MKAGLYILAILFFGAAACGGEEASEDSSLWIGAGGEGVLREADVFVDGEQVRLRVEDFDGTYVLEDDIVLDPEDVHLVEEDDTSRGLAAARSSKLWPNGVVYYRFSKDLPAYLRDRTERAMHAWEDQTSIRFRTAEAGRDDFVLIVPFNTNYCRANIGHFGRRQYVWLSDICTAGLIKHELGHTLGLYHEQTRNDRDQHVKILWDNIEESKKDNFRKYRSLGINARDYGDYDLWSIMHYGSWNFSTNGRPTIVRRSDGSPIGHNRDQISDKDAAGVNRLYR